MNVSTDQETDRLLSMRISSQVPLPPEIALTDPKYAEPYFSELAKYELYGIADHPLIRLILDSKLSIAMSAALSRASHLDRVSHYAAWMSGNAPVSVALLDPLVGSGAEGDAPSETPGQPCGCPHGPERSDGHNQVEAAVGHTPVPPPPDRPYAPGEARCGTP